MALSSYFIMESIFNNNSDTFLKYYSYSLKFLTYLTENRAKKVSRPSNIAFKSHIFLNF